MSVEASIWTPGDTVNISTNSKRAIQAFIATTGQTQFTLTNFTYAVNTQSLSVYKNGNILRYGIDFGEVSPSVFVLYTACVVGDIIYAVGFTEISGSATTTAAVDVSTSPVGVPISVEAALTYLYLYRQVMFESFAAIMLEDLSGYNAVATRGFYGGWASTTAGPKGGATYHRDGTTGTVSTAYSDNSGFYDANGDGFSLSLGDKVYAEMFGFREGGTHSENKTALQNAVDNTYSTIVIPEYETKTNCGSGIQLKRGITLEMGSTYTLGANNGGLLGDGLDAIFKTGTYNEGSGSASTIREITWRRISAENTNAMPVVELFGSANSTFDMCRMKAKNSDAIRGRFSYRCSLLGGKYSSSWDAATGTATDSTGDTDGSTGIITGMTDTSDFVVGTFVTVSAGFSSTTRPYRILSKTSTTVTLDKNSSSAQTNVTVAATKNNNFTLTFYDNCNGLYIRPDTVISGGSNGGGVDVAQSQSVDIDGIQESNGAANAVRIAGDCTEGQGNCYGVAVGGYYESCHNPFSYGGQSSVMGLELRKTYLGNANLSSPPDYAIYMARVRGCQSLGTMGFIGEGTEPCLIMDSVAGSHTSPEFINLIIGQVNNFGSSIDVSGLSNPQLSRALHDGNVQIGSDRKTGLNREYISETITANVGMSPAIIEVVDSYGGVIDSVEILEGSGSFTGATLEIGYSGDADWNYTFDLGTASLTTGHDDITSGIVAAGLRSGEEMQARVVAGSGTGTFRLRIKYRI